MADEIDESKAAAKKDSAPAENTSKTGKASADASADHEPPLDASAAGDLQPERVSVQNKAEETLSMRDTDPAASVDVNAAADAANKSRAFEIAQGRVESDGSAPQGNSGKPLDPLESDNVLAAELNKPGLELLYDVELDATLQFGSKEMLLRDVLELGPGDVVELDRHIAEPVDLVVGDRIVARGEVVVASGNFALRVTEVAAPQMRLESIRCLF